MLKLGLEGQMDVFQMRNPKTASQVDNNMCSSWRGCARREQQETQVIPVRDPRKLKESSARSGVKSMRRKTQGFKDPKRGAKETRCFQMASEPHLSLQPSWNLTGKLGSVTLSVCPCIVSSTKKF